MFFLSAVMVLMFEIPLNGKKYINGQTANTESRTVSAKKYWGYSDEQIKKWEEELTVTPQDIKDDLVFQIIIDNNIVGWYSLSQNNQEKWEIDNFWILPKYICQGIRLLSESQKRKWQRLDYMVSAKNSQP